MKTYEPRRNNECPNGLHAAYDPAKDPTQNECTCPWLIIQSSTPVQHLTSWNRRETENFIREVDRGYFDPPGYPKRSGSMFLSPAMQRLLDVAEKEPVAAALTLLAGSGSGLPPFDAVAWDAQDAVLSLRVGGGGWWHLFLGKSNVEAVTNHDDAHAAGEAPVLLWADHPDTAAETGLPEGLVSTPHEPAPDYFAEDITGTAPPIFAEVEALPQRVPQVPSDIAKAGHGEDYCTCDLNTRYTCPLCRTEETGGAVTGFPCDVADQGVPCAKMRGHRGPHENSAHDHAWFELDPR